MKNHNVVDLCRNLLREKSYSGEEGGVSAAVKAFWEERGLKEFTIDSYGNCIATVRGNKAGPEILFDAHIDTVPGCTGTVESGSFQCRAEGRQNIRPGAALI